MFWLSRSDADAIFVLRIDPLRPCSSTSAELLQKIENSNKYASKLFHFSILSSRTLISIINMLIDPNSVAIRSYLTISKRA
jgi:hypothetical protein